MDFQRIVHIVDAQSNDECKPKRQPYEHCIGRDLQQPFVPTRQCKQKSSNFIHKYSTVQTWYSHEREPSPAHETKFPATVRLTSAIDR